MEILYTIVPIFVVILVGWGSRTRGFLPEPFLGPANRLVYHLAIPAMIFRAISGSALRDHFDGGVLFITLGTMAVAFGVAWALGTVGRLEHRSFGTFVQSAFHGNLGYIGLAVAFYYLGEDGVVQAGIIAGFMMILQNFLAVVVLSVNGGTSRGADPPGRIILKILGNPVILAALAGILFSLSGMTLPLVVDRSLAIVSGMALPLALLIIGATLSFELILSRLKAVLSSAGIKLLVLPGLGWALYRLFGIPAQAYLPGLILLASPSATVVYILAREMGGDPDLAVAAISGSTLLSAATFFIWLNLATPAGG